MQDPRTLYPQPPYSEKQQSAPGSEKEMTPKVDHGEQSYQGTGRLKGRHALITGADSGIGRAVALAFAREGADVGVCYLSEHDEAKITERLVTDAGRRAAQPAEVAPIHVFLASDQVSYVTGEVYGVTGGQMPI